MTKGRRFAFPLKPDRSRLIRFGGPAFVTALISGLFLAFLFTPDLKSHQRIMGGVILGITGLACMVAMSKVLVIWAQTGLSIVELSAHPVTLGEEFRVYVLQRQERPGLKRVDVGIVNLWHRHRRDIERMVEFRIASVAPDGSLGLRAQAEAAFRIPEEEQESCRVNGILIRWGVEIRLYLEQGEPLVELYPFEVRRPPV